MTVKDQYQKERRRIQSFLRKAEKRGYQFNYELPQTPKKITKASVARLQKITPKVLYEKAVYGGSATEGEIVSAKVGRQAERKASAQKAVLTRKTRKAEQQINKVYPTIHISDEIIRMIEELPDIKYFGFDKKETYTSSKRMLISLINDRADIADQSNNLTQYIQYLADHLPEISVASETIFYSSDSVQVEYNFNQLYTILKGTPMTVEEAKLLENFNEYYENYDTDED